MNANDTAVSRHLHLLYLEDEPDFACLVRTLLEREGFRVEMALVDNRADFLAALEDRPFQIILADYQLPTWNGFQALEIARQLAPQTPFLLISGIIGEETAVESLKRGATDYILKNGINRLVPAVHRAVREAQEREQAREELKKAQGELAHVSRLAGMAEVATSVLHNVGNVLNSVNISVSLVSDELKKCRLENIKRVADLMREHASDIGEFMTRDPRGKQLPEYLNQLAQFLNEEQTVLLKEMQEIRKNIDHIKDIVAVQQNYAHLSGAAETVNVTDLVEDALRMNTGALMRHDVDLVRDFEPDLPEIEVQKHKVLQILINLIRNAKYACDESNQPDKRLTVKVSRGEERVRIDVIDNGVGISPENLPRLFQHGFTTRKHGHGFGLHSSRSAAKDLGGILQAHSDGPGHGATFTLEIPFRPPAR
jgi:C4-dicarboxylate-specific signal transduction histidine kinase